MGLIVGLPSPLMFFPFPVCPICSGKKKKNLYLPIKLQILLILDIKITFIVGYQFRGITLEKS